MRYSCDLEYSTPVLTLIDVAVDIWAIHSPDEQALALLAPGAPEVSLVLGFCSHTINAFVGGSCIQHRVMVAVCDMTHHQGLFWTYIFLVF